MNPSMSKQAAERLENDLDRQVASLRGGNRLFTFLGLVILVILVSYFSFVAGIIRREMAPKDLAKVLGAYASDFLIATIKETSGNLIKVAPEYSSELIDTGMNQALAWSRDTRFLIIGWLDERLEHVEMLVTRLIDYSYDQHSTDLKLLVKDIRTPAGRKAFEDFFTDILSAPLASESARIDIESLDMTLVALQERLTRLGHGENLSVEEAAERNLLLAFREFWGRARAN